jgi:16S rRNA (guanine1207-N2)-methyltransferase
VNKKYMTHYFSENQDSELNMKEISENVLRQDLKFYVASGVFSKSRLDIGSRILIDNCIMKDSWNVLDLGCGYGPVGIAIAKLYPKTTISMTDINKRAIMLTKKNITLNKLEKKRFTVMQGDSYSPLRDKKLENKYDTILLNPPQTAGKKLCLSMIKEAKDFLKPKGIIQIVARHNKGGSSFMKFMKEIYGNAEDICKSKGFRVYVSKR